MLTQLRYFIAIVDCGGMTAAGARLGVSQSALSRSIQALEFQLDATLFDRSAGGLKPTPAGELLLRRGRILLAEHESMLNDLSALATDAAAVTYLNGAPMTAMTLLPRILSRMQATHPGQRVSLRGDNGANYDWKLRAVADGEIDVALTLYDPTMRHLNLTQELLFEPVLRVLVRVGHPAAADPAADLASLRHYRWIMPPRRSSPREVVENEFRIHGIDPPRDSIEISDWRIALDLLASSDFVTAMPFHPACFDHQLDRLHVFPIDFSARPIAISMVTRGPAADREGTRAVLDTARALIAEADQNLKPIRTP